MFLRYNFSQTSAYIYIHKTESCFIHDMVIQFMETSHITFPNMSLSILFIFRKNNVIHVTWSHVP